jgi:hypothetical protein
MRAILIDPINETVIEVPYTGDYKQIYALLGIELFTTVELGGDNQETLFVDDEGLLHGETHFFSLVGSDWKYAQPLAGRGLILGANDEGESVATDLTVEQVRQNVSFAQLKVAGWTKGTEREIDHPTLGKVHEITTGQPILERVEEEEAGRDPDVEAANRADDWYDNRA